MITPHRRCIFILPLVLLGSSLAAQDNLGGPDQALVTGAKEAPIEIGVKIRVEQRALHVSGSGAPAGQVEANVVQILPRLAYAPLPWLQVFGEAGWARVDLDLEDDGDGDVAWAIGFTTDLFDTVIEESPVVGRKQTLGLRLEASYGRTSSGFSIGDLDYNEVRLAPMLRYAENRRGRHELRPYHPSGVTAEVGVAFSYIDGDLGGSDVEEVKDVGIVLGTSFRTWDSWLIDVQGRVYGEGDFSLGGGVTYLF